MPYQLEKLIAALRSVKAKDKNEMNISTFATLYARQKTSIHASELHAIIHAQLLSPIESIREIIANGIDAGSLSIYITLHPGQCEIKDRGRGMGLPQILFNLLLPYVSDKPTDESEGADEAKGEDAKKVIGQFGLGFFSTLTLLQTADDRIVVTTGKPDATSYVITLTKREDNYFVDIQQQEHVFLGTTVTITSSYMTNTIVNDIHTLITHTFCVNRNADIFINDSTLINIGCTKKGGDRYSLDKDTAYAQLYPFSSSASPHIELLPDLHKAMIVIGGIVVIHEDLPEHSHTTGIALHFPVETLDSKGEKKRIVSTQFRNTIHTELILSAIEQAIFFPCEKQIAYWNALAPLLLRIDPDLLSLLKTNVEAACTGAKIILPDTKEFNLTYPDHPSVMRLDHRLLPDNWKSKLQTVRYNIIDTSISYICLLVPFAAPDRLFFYYDRDTVVIDQTFFNECYGKPDEYMIKSIVLLLNQKNYYLPEPLPPASAPTDSETPSVEEAAPIIPCPLEDTALWPEITGEDCTLLTSLMDITDHEVALRALKHKINATADAEKCLFFLSYFLSYHSSDIGIRSFRTSRGDTVLQLTSEENFFLKNNLLKKLRGRREDGQEEHDNDLYLLLQNASRVSIRYGEYKRDTKSSFFGRSERSSRWIGKEIQIILQEDGNFKSYIREIPFDESLSEDRCVLQRVVHDPAAEQHQLYVRALRQMLSCQFKQRYSIKLNNKILVNRIRGSDDCKSYRKSTFCHGLEMEGVLITNQYPKEFEKAIPAYMLTALKENKIVFVRWIDFTEIEPTSKWRYIRSAFAAYFDLFLENRVTLDFMQYDIFSKMAPKQLDIFLTSEQLADLNSLSEAQLIHHLLRSIEIKWNVMGKGPKQPLNPEWPKQLQQWFICWQAEAEAKEARLARISEVFRETDWREPCFLKEAWPWKLWIELNQALLTQWGFPAIRLGFSTKFTEAYAFVPNYEQLILFNLLSVESDVQKLQEALRKNDINLFCEVLPRLFLTLTHEIKHTQETRGDLTHHLEFFMVGMASNLNIAFQKTHHHTEALFRACKQYQELHEFSPLRFYGETKVDIDIFFLSQCDTRAKPILGEGRLKEISDIKPEETADCRALAPGALPGV